MDDGDNDDDDDHDDEDDDHDHDHDENQASRAHNLWVSHTVAAAIPARDRDNDRQVSPSSQIQFLSSNIIIIIHLYSIPLIL